MHQKADTLKRPLLVKLLSNILASLHIFVSAFYLYFYISFYLKDHFYFFLKKFIGLHKNSCNSGNLIS